MDLSFNLDNVFHDADKINGNSNANSVSCLWNELVRGNTFYRLLTQIPVSSHEGCVFSRSPEEDITLWLILGTTYMC